MDVDAGPANHERPPRKLQTANSRTNSQTTHPFVAQTRSIKDKPSGRVLPPPVLDRSCAPRSGRRQGRAKEWCPQIEQKNGSPYKEREKRKLGGSPVALLTGVPEKRQGTKSRGLGTRRCSSDYGEEIKGSRR